MTLDFDQVVEGVGAAYLAGMDRADEQIPDLGTVQGAITQRILSVKNAALQGPLGCYPVGLRPGGGTRSEAASGAASN